MDKQHLHDMLQELHQELEQVQSVGEAERQLLQDLMQDIREALARSEAGEAAQYQSLLGRLAHTLEQFESSHPILTLTIGRVVDTLHAILP